MSRRLPNRTERREIHLELEGERIPAREGEPIAASLLAAGKDVFSRGVKYHRARGPFCLSGRCSHCLLRVDGEPNVFSCITPAKDGMRLERQNAFPSVSVDVFSTIDWMYPRGMDHHSLFAGVPVVEKVVARVARQMAGLGKLPDAARSADATCLEHETEVLVVGGGISGLSAAAAAAEAGVSVSLVDEGEAFGGRIESGLVTDFPVDWKEGKLSILRGAGAHLLPSTFAFGLYREDGFLIAARAPGRRLLVIRPKAVVVATGSSELLPLFPNNDLPGVFGARALARLIRRDGVAPGRSAVVCGDGEEAEALAELLRSVGCEVVARAGLTPGENGHVVRARGRGRVAGAILRDACGRDHKVRCEIVAVADHRSAFLDLARQGGVGVSWKEPEGFGVETSESGATGVPGLFACGEVTGGRGPRESEATGRRAGESAARFLRGGAP